MRRPGCATLCRKMRRFDGFAANAQRFIRQILDKSEVQDFDEILLAILHAQHQVRWFEVAVNHPALVGFAQRFEDLLTDVQTAIVAQSALILEHFGQRLAVEPFHDEEQQPRLGLTIVEYRYRVGVA